AAATATLGGPTQAVIQAQECGDPCVPVASATVDVSVVAPFEVRLDTPRVTLDQGAALPRALQATIARPGGFAGDVTFQADELPPGVEATGFTIPSGATVGVVALRAAAAVPLGTSRGTLFGTGTGFVGKQAFDLEVVAAGGAGPTISRFTR